ncbi:MAG: DeoR family transcriptional regulator [marine bacterium B5-7]|nr:MAG: DeoR family transcriptional regulator [marine bacterium B5-7]
MTEWSIVCYDHDMRPGERQSTIADIVRDEGRVTVEALTRHFGASAETIRRDLATLSREGIIRKVHGGAVFPGSRGEDPFQKRMGHNIAAKRHIAKKAITLVSAGDTLFIDTGTTTLMFARELGSIDNLTIITNSIEIARVVSTGNSSASLFLVGGAYNADNRQTFGMMAMSQIEMFRGTLAVLAIGTVDAAAGAMDYNIEEAQVARAMIKQSQSAVILSDSSKFNRIAPFAVGPLSCFNTLVCETEPKGSLQRALEQSSVEIVF